MEWCHWWELGSCDNDTSISGIKWLKKSSVAYCFSFLYLVNTSGLLPLASHDADISTNNVKWLIKSGCISFWLSWTDKCISAIDDTISVMWCQCLPHMTENYTTLCFNHLDLANKMVSLTMPSVLCDAHIVPAASHSQELCHTLFQLSSPNEFYYPTDDAVFITWQQCWY